MRCWYTRWQISNALDRGELTSRLGRGHAARCASCQAFARSLAQLHDQLSRDAQTAATPPPVVRRARSRWLLAGPLAAGAAAAIAVAVTSGGGPPTPVAESPAPIPDAVLGVRGVVGQVSQMLTTTPLDTELDNLIHDSKRGWDAVLATGGLH